MKQDGANHECWSPTFPPTQGSGSLLPNVEDYGTKGIAGCSAAQDVEEGSGQLFWVMDDKQQIWEHEHYRYGLAGEGQADIIQRFLERDRGRVLDIGCGSRGEKIRNLAAHTVLLVAADKPSKAVESARASAGPCQNVLFVASDARNLCLADGSIDHIVALGLFDYTPAGEARYVLSEFHRVCRAGGHLMLSNSVAHPREHHVDSAREVGFRLLSAHEGHCPVASRRYLLVFVKK